MGLFNCLKDFFFTAISLASILSLKNLAGSGRLTGAQLASLYWGLRGLMFLLDLNYTALG